MQPNRFFPRALRLAMAAVPLCLALAAQAQGYPNRVVRLIEPAGPGSAVDNYARQLTPACPRASGSR
jgi:tripartite-type tricarboxylate transporter receptor subunit TctC